RATDARTPVRDRSAECGRRAWPRGRNEDLPSSVSWVSCTGRGGQVAFVDAPRRAHRVQREALDVERTAEQALHVKEQLDDTEGVEDAAPHEIGIERERRARQARALVQELGQNPEKIMGTHDRDPPSSCLCRNIPRLSSPKMSAAAWRSPPRVTCTKSRT